MNAIELADCLEEILKGTAIGKDCTAMLRQQDKEIKDLRQIVESTIKQAFYEDDYHKLKAEYDLFKADLEDCTCQGGHSEAYLKVKKESKK